MIRPLFSHPLSSLVRGGLIFGLLAGILVQGSLRARADEPPTGGKSSAEDTGDTGDPLAAEREEVFRTYRENLEVGQKARAADALVAIVQDEEAEPFHPEAWSRLGTVLVELDLRYGALVAFSHALYADIDAGGSEAIVSAIELADEVGDTAILEPVFAANVGGTADRLTRSRMAYLAARENYRESAYNVALGLLKLVVTESLVYPDAKMLEAVILNQQGQPVKALPALQTALAAATEAGRSDRFVSAVHLNLGRTFFAAENFPRSIEYYANVSRQSDFWLEAQYERAWAHFRLEDMSGALGLLHNHESPFFDSYYFPEGELLRIYSLFLLCKFPEASKAIDDFKAQYAPVRQELETTLASMTPQQAWELATRYVKTGEAEFPIMLLRPFRREARLESAITAVDHAVEETDRLEAIAANPFSALVTREVNARRQEIIQEEGERILTWLRDRSAELGRMLNDAEMSKLDMLQLESRLYQTASQTGEAALQKDRRVTRRARVRKGYVWWPWQGEYWADELGYYRVSAIPECPRGMRTGAEEAR